MWRAIKLTGKGNKTSKNEKRFQFETFQVFCSPTLKQLQGGEKDTLALSLSLSFCLKEEVRMQRVEEENSCNGTYEHLKGS